MHFYKKYFFSFFFVVFFNSLDSIANADPNNLNARGVGDTEKVALDDAKKNIVSQACGETFYGSSEQKSEVNKKKNISTQEDSKSLSINSNAIDQNTSLVGAYIKSYKIINKGKDNDLFFVEIKVEKVECEKWEEVKNAYYKKIIADQYKKESEIRIKTEQKLVEQLDKAETEQWRQITLPDGSKYNGQIKNGKKNGQGILEFDQYTKYNGEFRNDKFWGRGRYSFHDKEKGINYASYDGEWKDGKKDGQGKLDFMLDKKYAGEWKGISNSTDNIASQFSTINLLSGHYEGSFKDDKFNGYGTMRYADSSEYSGEWKDNKPNGKGNLTDVRKTKFMGEWKDGKKNGEFTINLSNGDHFVGQFKDDKPNGKGTYTYSNGISISAEFESGKVTVDGKGTINGKGSVRLSNGAIWTGNLKDGKPDGIGEVPGGGCLEFKNGVFLAMVSCKYFLP